MKKFHEIQFQFCETGWEINSLFICTISSFLKLQDFLLIQKFVCRMKLSKRETVHSQIFEMRANLGPYFLSLPSFNSFLNELDVNFMGEVLHQWIDNNE